LLDDYEFDFVQGQMPHVEGRPKYIPGSRALEQKSDFQRKLVPPYDRLCEVQTLGLLQFARPTGRGGCRASAATTRH
jgi:hypothetical protein